MGENEANKTVGSIPVEEGSLKWDMGCAWVGFTQESRTGGQ